MAFKYAMNNGVEREADYKYHPVFHLFCHYKKDKTISDLRVTSYADVAPKDNEQMKAAVAMQPIAIGMNASHLQVYHGGIFSGSCSTKLNHGVLVVGYGQEPNNGRKYWIVKNSWGPKWGENGYFRIARDEGKGEAECGMTDMASYPILE